LLGEELIKGCRFYGPDVEKSTLTPTPLQD